MLKRYFRKDVIEAGCDEAGRGCLAGPVVAAAVILPEKFRNSMLNDSKLLNEKQRDKLRLIIEKKAEAWAVQFIYPREIDKINILQASIRGMHHAVDQLSVCPELLLIDGKYFYPEHRIPHQCIIKGDSKYLSIAAASVLAKTHRDEYMKKLHDRYPHYGWEHNKGYPNWEHRQQILRIGCCEEHRQSFKLFPDPEQLSLFEEIPDRQEIIEIR